jgi:hypothetical protein
VQLFIASLSHCDTEQQQEEGTSDLQHKRIWDNKRKTRQKQQFPHHSFIT